jgi:hypothetical protein
MRSWGNEGRLFAIQSQPFRHVSGTKRDSALPKGKIEDCFRVTRLPCSIGKEKITRLTKEMEDGKILRQSG